MVNIDTTVNIFVTLSLTDFNQIRVGCQVLTAASMEMAFFWVAMPCRDSNYTRCRYQSRDLNVVLP
jgi:hypothetical protein